MGDNIASMGDGVAFVNDYIVTACIFITLVLMLLIRRYNSIRDVNLVITITIIDLL